MQCDSDIDYLEFMKISQLEDRVLNKTPLTSAISCKFKGSQATCIFDKGGHKFRAPTTPSDSVIFKDK